MAGPRALHRVGDGPRTCTSRPLRVCLIRPPAITAPRSLSYYGAVPDLGLAYIAAAARAAGHHVRVIDAPGLAIEQHWEWSTALGALRGQGLTLGAIAERVPFDVDVVGIAHMF